MKNNPTELDKILDAGEAEYLDNGGGLSSHRRDHYFVLVTRYARRLERKLRAYERQSNNYRRRTG